VGLDLRRLGGLVRPTREGRSTPFRAGLVFSGIGVNPDVPTDDPEPPTNWAASSNSGQAYVPFTSPSGSAAVVQYKTGVSASGAGVVVTLDESPSIGNLLVLCITVNDDSDPVFTITNGTWTQIGSTVYSGNGTNWPNRMYYQAVTSSTSAATTIDSTGGLTDTGNVKVGIIELSGVDTLDQTASATNTSTTTATLTPTASKNAIIISATARRTPGSGVLSPAGSMTEWAEIGTSPYGLNYQVIATTSGGYTVGSTGASVNSSMIAAAFIDTGVSTNWVDAPLAIDGSDSTYEGVSQEHSPFLRHTLADSKVMDRARLVVSWTSNTSRTITLQGADESDFSDAVTIDTHTYTPTGGLGSSDTLDLSWTTTDAYKYFQYLTSVENWYRVFESELYQSGTGSVFASSVASNALALGGVVVGNSASSNTHFVATSSTTGLWLPHAEGGGTVSYGSNASHVAEIATAGVGTAVARFDHYHAGLTQLTSSSSNTLQRGTVNLRAGANIAFGLTDTDGDGEFDTLTISSLGGGGGGGTDLSSVIGTGSGATVVGTVTDTGASPLSLTAPGSIASGDLVVLAGQFVNSVPNASGPSGGAAWNEALRYDTSSNEYQVVYWKVAGASETTWTLTHSVGTDCAVAAVVYRGVDDLWSKGFEIDSLTAPWVIGHPEGLRVLIWFTLTAGEPVLTIDGDALTSDVHIEAAGGNEPQVLIAHRDTVASFDAGPVRCIGDDIALYPGAFSAVFYNAP
jgi:hypothetical protein